MLIIALKGKRISEVYLWGDSKMDVCMYLLIRIMITKSLNFKFIFPKFHYEVVVILLWLIIVNWIWFIHAIFAVPIIILYNIYLLPNNQAKRARLLKILFHLSWWELDHLYKLINKLNSLQVGLTCCVNILN